MNLFSNKFRHKVLQMTYKPSGRKRISPKEVIDDLGKAIDEGMESMFILEEKDDGDDNSDDNDNG